MKVLVPHKHNEIMLVDIKFGQPFWHNDRLLIRLDTSDYTLYVPDKAIVCAYLDTGRLTFIPQLTPVIFDDNVCITELQSEENMDREISIECAARRLCEKLREITNNEEYKGIWPYLLVHGWNYSGPNFGKELKDLEEKLAL